MNTRVRSEIRSFHLKFNKKNREKVLNKYIPHVIKMAEAMKDEKKAIKLYTSNDRYSESWTGVNLNHPATFETLAMDSELKRMVLEDLERFVRRKEYYRRVGKAWKRGYLLYGPPGTGKSSLIAAMANYLRFDIYDLELTEVRSNHDLRRYLLDTANRSILVVEDIDCSVKFTDRDSDASEPQNSRREHQVTLSGLLNFIDGLWSSCGDERIIIFTTNHMEKLDHALLRPGRMDVHIHMSYCTPCGFRLLASNYLELKDHSLFNEIDELIKQVQITPAEVAEQLLKHDEPESALKDFIGLLTSKGKEKEEAESKKLHEESKESDEKKQAGDT
ncbi:Protein HYPER-SENSITIVITY-RELATED 4 [Dionaea muscipula]